METLGKWVLDAGKLRILLCVALFFISLFLPVHHEGVLLNIANDEVQAHAKCIERTRESGSDVFAAYRSEWCDHCRIVADALFGDRTYTSGDETIESFRMRYPCKRVEEDDY